MSKTLVLDAGALLRINRKLVDGFDELATTEAALKEVRDRESKQRLESLALDLKVRAPLAKHLKRTVAFAKRTGDFVALSKTDLEIIALTLEIESLKNGVPEAVLSADEQVGDRGTIVSVAAKKVTLVNDTKVSAKVSFAEMAKKKSSVVAVDKKETSAEERVAPRRKRPFAVVPEAVIPPASQEVAWSSPSDPFASSFGNERACELRPHASDVACSTTDFAMQNVLLQMGLRTVSVDGIAITSAKAFHLHCHSCFNVDRDVSNRRFCSRCGSDTLTRLTCEVNSNGEFKYFGKTNYRHNVRGTKYSIGRNEDLLLREDQTMQRGKWHQKAKLAQSAKAGLTVGHGRTNPNAANRRRK